MREYIRTHSVVDVMVITFTALVAFTILFGAVAVMIIEIIDHTTDTTNITDALTSMITAILGALLGLIAGRSETMNVPLVRSDDPEA
jgi:hypothetical protein